MRNSPPIQIRNLNLLRHLNSPLIKFCPQTLFLFFVIYYWFSHPLLIFLVIRSPLILILAIFDDIGRL